MSGSTPNRNSKQAKRPLEDYDGADDDIDADEAMDIDEDDDTSSKKGRGRESRANKGLKHFSVKVCEELEKIRVTTYNEIANVLLSKMQDDSSHDEKNIRRRIYDALNVLMAMDIITKEKKMIRWKGIQVPSRVPTVSEEVDAARERVRIKSQMLEDMVTQFIGLKNCMERNSVAQIARQYSHQDESKGEIKAEPSAFPPSKVKQEPSAVKVKIEERKEQNPGASESNTKGAASDGSDDCCDPHGAAKRLPLPFVLISSGPKAHISCMMSPNRRNIRLDYNTPFVIHDDNTIIRRIGHMEICKSPADVPDELRPLLPSFFSNQPPLSPLEPVQRIPIIQPQAQFREPQPQQPQQISSRSRQASPLAVASPNTFATGWGNSFNGAFFASPFLSMASPSPLSTLSAPSAPSSPLVSSPSVFTPSRPVHTTQFVSPLASPSSSALPSSSSLAAPQGSTPRLNSSSASSSSASSSPTAPSISPSTPFHLSTPSTLHYPRSQFSTPSSPPSPSSSVPNSTHSSVLSSPVSPASSSHIASSSPSTSSLAQPSQTRFDSSSPHPHPLTALQTPGLRTPAHPATTTQSQQLAIQLQHLQHQSFASPQPIVSSPSTLPILQLQQLLQQQQQQGQSQGQRKSPSPVDWVKVKAIVESTINNHQAINTPNALIVQDSNNTRSQLALAQPSTSPRSSTPATTSPRASIPVTPSPRASASLISTSPISSPSTLSIASSQSATAISGSPSLIIPSPL